MRRMFSEELVSVQVQLPRSVSLLLKEEAVRRHQSRRGLMRTILEAWVAVLGAGKE